MKIPVFLDRGRRVVLALVFVFSAMGWAPPAQADEYIRPTYSNLIDILVRFGALDLSDNTVLDNFAMTHECELFARDHANDFRWHDIQKALRQDIRQKVATYPTGLYYFAKLQLGHYDFKEKFYRFTPKTSPKNVNLFTLDANFDTPCLKGGMSILPTSFKLVIDQPVTLAGIPLNVEEGETLLHRMEEGGNKDHIVYARLGMRILYVDKLKQVEDRKGRRTGPLVQGRGDLSTRLDAHLAIIDFFEDEAMTKLIYSYRP